MSFDLTIKPTEVEIAESISFADPVTARVLRRLAFQRDQLNAENERLRNAVDDIMTVAEEWWLVPNKSAGTFMRYIKDKCREALEGTT